MPAPQSRFLLRSRSKRNKSRSSKTRSSRLAAIHIRVMRSPALIFRPPISRFPTPPPGVDRITRRGESKLSRAGVEECAPLACRQPFGFNRPRGVGSLKERMKLLVTLRTLMASEFRINVHRHLVPLLTAVSAQHPSSASATPPGVLLPREPPSARTPCDPPFATRAKVLARHRARGVRSSRPPAIHAETSGPSAQ